MPDMPGEAGLDKIRGPAPCGNSAPFLCDVIGVNLAATCIDIIIILYDRECMR